LLGLGKHLIRMGTQMYIKIVNNLNEVKKLMTPVKFQFYFLFECIAAAVVNYTRIEDIAIHCVDVQYTTALVKKSYLKVIFIHV